MQDVLTCELELDSELGALEVGTIQCPLRSETIYYN